MAKQVGDIILVGTIDDITFYEMEGRGYARKKTSLTGRKVKRDPRFQRTMQSAHRLGRGSQLASKVYRSLPRSKQVYALFKELKSIAILGIKQGKGEAEVLGLLQQRVAKETSAKETGSLKVQRTQLVPFVPSFTKRLIEVSGGRKVIKVRNERFKPCPNHYREQRE